MRLLVTGGCGFIGSNFVPYVLQHYGPEMITNLDALTTGRLENLAGAAETYGDRYEFLQAEIADVEKIEAVLEKHQFFAVVHFAAASASASATATLLERARRHGVRRFLLVSTDLPGRELVAAEERALAAHLDHGQEVVITRATDNYGAFQRPIGLIPVAIIQALRDQPVAISGDGLQTRDWLHVEDHCAALFTALLDGQPGGIYHLASGHEMRDLDLVERILEHLGKSRDLVKLLPDQPEQERPRVHDSAHAPEPLAWKPRHRLDQSLPETIDWYVRNREWWESDVLR